MQVIVTLEWERGDESAPGFDLDIEAFLCDENEKALSDDHMIFYNNMTGPLNFSRLVGDDRMGGQGEYIELDLEKMPLLIKKIFITVTIYEADIRLQNFGQVKNAKVKVSHPRKKESFVSLDLTEDFSIESALIACEIERTEDGWEFKELGVGFKGGLNALCENFGIQVINTN